MIPQQRGTSHSSSGWNRPVDLDRYDRTPTLTCSEKDALVQLTQRFDNGKTAWPPDIRNELRRLVIPINNVFTLVRYEGTVVNTVRTLLLHEMRTRGTSYWAWSEDEWLGLMRYQTPRTKRFINEKNIIHPLMTIAYLLGDIFVIPDWGLFQARRFANRVFGAHEVQTAVECVCQELQGWGYGKKQLLNRVNHVLCLALLMNRSPRLEDLTHDRLANLPYERLAKRSQTSGVLISQALVSLNILARPLPPVLPSRHPHEFIEIASAEWISWCQRWKETSVLTKASRGRISSQIKVAGRWLATVHPEITSPAQWTRAIAAEYVAAVQNFLVGQYTEQSYIAVYKRNKPLMPRTKGQYLTSLRTFFTDCQENEWIPRRFDPQRALDTPRTIRNLIGPEPRIIADDTWAKLLSAGLNLQYDDLPLVGWVAGPGTQREPYYPLEMMQALCVVWLFAALRSNEIRRLRVGCVRWYQDDVVVTETGTILPKDAVCKLTVPTNKTTSTFVKAVDRVVGEAIETWERIRPAQPAVLDTKTNEYVDYLFFYRGHGIGVDYLNQTIIPLLCRKAGTPEEDARGRLTSHRARATIASQLLNAKEGLTLEDLREWLGHKSVETTRSYAKPSPTRVAKAYEQADYFRRNLRTIEVLLDQEAIRRGAAASGEPYMYYDLGHGYCTNDFFAQCPHRMACARCDFYRPKSALLILLEESKTHLLTMKQDLKLTDAELTAIDGDLMATEKLITGLSDIPTPAGPTPRQLEEWYEYRIELTSSERTSEEARSLGN